MNSANLYDKITLKGKQSQDNISPKTYKGFSTISPDAENYALFDFDLIKQDLLNHFNIRQGERLMNPKFGTIIWDLLFEPLTEDIKFLITENVNTIINYDPRLVAKDVIVTTYESGIQIECILSFLPYNIQQSMQLRFDQANGLLSTYLKEIYLF
jgi:phage baseplate assembly protein W